MIFLNWGAMPVPSNRTTNPIEIIFKYFKEPVEFLKLALDWSGGRILRRLNIVKKYELVFIAGSVLASIDQYAKKVISFNLCDYDNYTNNKYTNKRLVTEKYAVFLDTNLPYQSDLALVGLPVVSALPYFKSLNRFFDVLEKSYGLKVVIAAHPTSNYSSELFNGREIYRMQSPELVKNAEFCIAHNSTAISYAVLNEKPMIFIFTEEMRDIYKKTVMLQIASLANYFEVETYNVDTVSCSEDIVIKAPNLEIYQKYKYSYLTSLSSENMLSSEIFFNEIRFL
jgi:hypothetical protein